MCPLPASSSTTLVIVPVVAQSSHTMMATTMMTMHQDAAANKGGMIIRYKEEALTIKQEQQEIPQTISSEDELVKTRASFSSSDSTCTVASSVSSDLPPLDELLVDKLGRAMEAVARAGDMTAPMNGSDRDCFSSRTGRQPSIALSAYLRRMLKYVDNGNGSASWTSLSSGAKALIAAIIFIDRIVSSTQMVVTSVKIHRLMAAGILVALKMNEDAIVDMTFFASLAGVHMSEIKKLESAFLEKINWKTFVSEADFSARIASFERLTTAKPKSKSSKKAH